MLDERSTLLIVRKLPMGSTRFDDLQRGVPRMSSSLLSKRLRELERGGIVHPPSACGARRRLRVTQAGEALGPLIVSLRTWSRDRLKRSSRRGRRTRRCRCGTCAQPPPRPTARGPRRRLLRYRDAEDGKRAWLLVAEPSNADLCFPIPPLDRPRHRRRATGDGGGRRQDRPRSGDAREGSVRGPDHLVRSMPDWLGLSAFAYPDPAAELPGGRKS